MSSRLSILCALLFVGGITPVIVAQTATPYCLAANDLSIATGQPLLTTFSSQGTMIPVWSLSGGTVGQSVVGIVPGFPADCRGVKVEIVVITTDGETAPKFSDVYRVHLSQIIEGSVFTARSVTGDSVQTALPVGPFLPRTIVLESFYEIRPDAPLTVRIQREPADPADTFTRPTGLAMVKVTPLPAPAPAYVVQDVRGYNSWPMMQAIGDKLVCVYSRGKGHTIDSGERNVYVRTSADRGKTWAPEITVASTPDYGEVAIGKGLDSTGAMLLWVRRIGKEHNHDLYRTTDGAAFTRLTTVCPEVMPVQITDVFAVPTVGLMALWFAGNYNDDGPSHSWGTLVSRDDGKTWTQNVVESELTKAQWPTEPSAVYLGDGKIFAVARLEVGESTTARSQFQMFSTDYGKTWQRSRTNISDVRASTPSLVFDAETGLLSNYYYHRGRGVVRRRVVSPEDVIGKPLSWPPSEAVALGSAVTWDSGNVNATVISGAHYLTYYSGKHPDTTIFVTEVPSPTSK